MPKSSNFDWYRLLGGGQGGKFPTEIILFEDAKIIDDHTRDDFIECCLAHNLLNKDDLVQFDKIAEAQEVVFTKSKNICGYIVEYIRSGKDFSRTNVSLGYYLFFRGMFVASAMGLICFVATSLLFLSVIVDYPSFITNNLHYSKPAVNLVCSLLGVIVCFSFWRLFRYECSRLALGYAQVIQRVFCSATKLMKNTAS